MKEKGFTLIELIIVLIVLGILFGIASLMIGGRFTKAKETALKHNLYIMRKSIDDFCSDKKRYPNNLQELVDEKYIREIPVDPFTESNETWHTISSKQEFIQGKSDIFDVKSGSDKTGTNGKPYNEW